jgi:hypothetical protein
MPTYNASDLLLKPARSSALANQNVIFGTVTPSANVAAADVIRFAIIPAGTWIHRVTVVNASLGTTIPGSLEFAPVDGSTKTTFSSADYAFGTASANGTAIVKKPVLVSKDSYLQVTITSVSTPSTGEVTLIAEGEGFGAK